MLAVVKLYGIGEIPFGIISPKLQLALAGVLGTSPGNVAVVRHDDGLTGPTFSEVILAEMEEEMYDSAMQCVAGFYSSPHLIVVPNWRWY